MNTNSIVALGIGFVLAFAGSARAELRHVEIKTLGMD